MQDNLDAKNYYAFNPSFDKCCNPPDVIKTPTVVPVPAAQTIPSPCGRGTTPGCAAPQVCMEDKVPDCVMTAPCAPVMPGCGCAPKPCAPACGCAQKPCAPVMPLCGCEPKPCAPVMPACGCEPKPCTPVMPACGCAQKPCTPAMPACGCAQKPCAPGMPACECAPKACAPAMPSCGCAPKCAPCGCNTAPACGCVQEQILSPCETATTLPAVDCGPVATPYAPPYTKRTNRSCGCG